MAAPKSSRRSRRNSQGDLSERAKAWVELSCPEQGVAVKMTDSLALAKIADILLEGREKRTSGEK